MGDKVTNVGMNKELAKKIRIEAVKREMTLKDLVAQLIEKGLAAEKAEKEKGTR